MSKVLLVGCGHMGSALLNAWIELKAYSFTVVDPFSYNELKKKYYKKKIHFYNKTPNQSQIKKFDIIILQLNLKMTKKVVIEYQNFELQKKFRN